MVLPQLKYNPGFHSEQALIHSFVVRKAELALILETLQENTGQSNQHLLIVGPRGTGKTTLVRRVAAAVHEDPTLGARWYPIIFGEESYQVLSPGEFWLEALFQLQGQTDDLRWCRVYQDLQKEPDDIRLRDRALAQLMDFADEQGKGILLIVENLNMLLGEQLKSEDAWDLRHTLQNEPRLMLLATATSRFEGVQNIDQAWFELLSVQELKPLDQQECRTLWEAISGEETPEINLRPIQILTGGNPRLLRILADFSSRKYFRELMDELTQLVDDHSEYFKSQLDNLAAAERKVFVTLLEIWDPVGAREVARAARMEVSKTSSLLHRLMNRRAVTLLDSPGRKKLYQVAERLYNIYYLMRRRGHASNRVCTVVNFMGQFYNEKELGKSISGLTEAAARSEPILCRESFDIYQEKGLAVRESLSTRVASLGMQGKWEGALALARPFVDAADGEKEVVREVIDFLICASAAGYAKEALALVTQSKVAANLEPLIVGLKIFLGERPLVAQEIFEVGQDVAERIRKRQESQEKKKQD
jgi:ABC-type iron transport system FetAB ATPase subunit